MSTYIDPRKLNVHSDYKDCPELVVQYLYDLETIRGLSPRTVNGYYIDLRTFFHYMKLQRAGAQPLDLSQEISLQDIDIRFIRDIHTADIYEFLYYVTRERENAPASRARKLSSLKGFFKYLCNKRKLLEINPTDDVGMPVQKKRLPKYLSLEEGLALLDSVHTNAPTDFPQRDYCMLTLFLNCGMRLSELVGMNVTDIHPDGTIRIVGKGNKERLVYLNAACHTALDALLAERAKLQNVLPGEKALFLSRKTGKRLSPRRVQQIVAGCLQTAGLTGRGYSVHKLRHTAATLMYQEGHVDMLALKEILGHAHVSTTEIYTHMGTQQLKDAANASPFSHVKPSPSTFEAKKQAPAPEAALQEQAEESEERNDGK